MSLSASFVRFAPAVLIVASLAACGSSTRPATGSPTPSGSATASPNPPGTSPLRLPSPAPGYVARLQWGGKGTATAPLVLHHARHVAVSFACTGDGDYKVAVTGGILSGGCGPASNTWTYVPPSQTIQISVATGRDNHWTLQVAESPR